MAALGPSIWDDYERNQYGGGAALDAAKSAAEGNPAPPVVTSGNAAWRAAQAGQPQPTPVEAAQQPPRQPFTIPAISDFLSGNKSGDMTSLGATFQPSNIPQPSGQIPIGGYGLGALSSVGYSRSPQVNMSDFLNTGSPQPQPPTMTGYHWYKGTGGLAGGNDANMDVFYNNGTKQNVPAVSPGEARPQLPNIQYTLPGVNAGNRALSDPSVGALKGAERFTNQFGQNVVNPNRGGQITSGAAYSPSYGSLAGSTEFTDTQGTRTLNTPQGGQIEVGSSLRKKPNFGPANQGQVYLGGFY